jgi:cbb3-type cytochrome oxidase subunit 3
MSLPELAVVLVAVAFTALVVWVLLPRNKKRFEDDARIPLDDTEEERR